MASFTGTAGDDIYEGTAAADFIKGEGGDDFLIANGGNDDIRGGDGNDYLSGGEGNDFFVGGKGNDVISGGADNDAVFWEVGDGNDRANGGNGFDEFQASGSTGSDSFTLGKTDTNVVLRRGNTITLSQVERVFILGREGNDRLTVNDTSGTSLSSIYLYGGLGNDILDASDASLGVFVFGDEGNDILTGSTFWDALTGGSGSDRLLGDTGIDNLRGNTGADEFVYRTPSEGNAAEPIQDFSAAESDSIVVSARGFGGGLRRGTLSNEQFTLGANATTAAHRFIYNGGTLYFDSDGSGMATKTALATLSGAPPLSASNIVIEA